MTMKQDIIIFTGATGKVLQEANVEQMEKNGGELLEFMMNLKIKVKLKQLLKFCPQLKK